MASDPKVLTELTSKKYKKLMAVGAILFIVGAVIGISNSDEFGPREGWPIITTATICILGLGTILVASVLSWWHHG